MRKPARVLCLIALAVLAVTFVLRAQTRSAAIPREDNMYRPYAAGLYARRVFSTPSPNRDYTVEVWRFSVPPNTRSAEIVLPGAATVTVYLGNVVVVSSGKQQALGLGGSVVLQEGERVTFANSGRRPANLRAVIFRGEG